MRTVVDIRVELKIEHGRIAHFNRAGKLHILCGLSTHSVLTSPLAHVEFVRHLPTHAAHLKLQHDEPMSPLSVLPPPYSESALVLSMKEGTAFLSPFDEPINCATSGCALVSTIVITQILLLEKQAYRNAALLDGIQHPRFRQVNRSC